METNTAVNKSNRLLDESYVTVACSKNLRHQLACRNIAAAKHDDDTSSCSTSASADLWSEEIPVWVHNEQRFISGITEDTTCLDLIEAILQDECVTGKPDFTSRSPKDYVVTERWKKVEQVLDSRTPILSIWTAWGNAQPEVRFTLRPFNQHFREMWQNSGDRDSGRGSPTGSINSGITRRKRHRASKSSLAWLTHRQTLHPKSPKNSIERLMKLILEQGEIIQQQLAKLRDREVEITSIEEEQHKLREKEHGKNYLLETYLKGLQDCDEKESGTGDSGVHTEEVTTSPEVGHVEEPLEPSLKSDENKEATDESKDAAETVTNDEIMEQIELLEKIVAINKRLQREEETIVRFTARVKRYEADESGLTEQQVKDALERISVQIDTGNEQLEMMKDSIKSTESTLQERSLEMKKLYDELEELEVEHNRLSGKPAPTLSMDHEYPSAVTEAASLYPIREFSRAVEDPVPEDMFVHPIEPPLQFCTPHDPQNVPVCAQVHTLNSIPKSPYAKNLFATASHMNYLEKYNQRIQQSNVNNNMLTATNLKLGPKKLLSGMVMHDANSNSSDTGLSMGSSTGDLDITQIGTLV